MAVFPPKLSFLTFNRFFFHFYIIYGFLLSEARTADGRDLSQAPAAFTTKSGRQNLQSMLPPIENKIIRSEVMSKLTMFEVNSTSFAFDRGEIGDRYMDFGGCRR